jgi:hypothetical protein
MQWHMSTVLTMGKEKGKARVRLVQILKRLRKLFYSLVYQMGEEGTAPQVNLRKTRSHRRPTSSEAEKCGFTRLRPQIVGPWANLPPNVGAGLRAARPSGLARGASGQRATMAAEDVGALA